MTNERTNRRTHSNNSKHLCVLQYCLYLKHDKGMVLRFGGSEQSISVSTVPELTVVGAGEIFGDCRWLIIFAKLLCHFEYQWSGNVKLYM